MTMNKRTNYKLIIAIVPKGLGTKMISVSKKAGSRGGTIVFGKGTAEKRIYENILGISYQPEKEIGTIIVEDKYVNKVLEHISKKESLIKKVMV